MPDFDYEDRFAVEGVVVGVDEAGRGPLAGPVVVGAAIVERSFSHPWLDDSKKLTELRREKLFDELSECEEVRWAVSVVGVKEIEELNILKATHVGMARAVEELGVAPGICLIDGLEVPGFPYRQEAIVKGDGKSVSIAAASICAKVTRDRLMREFAEKFPGYGFEKHKGYGTKGHLEALRRLGPCEIHRRTFQPVAQMSLPLG